MRYRLSGLARGLHGVAADAANQPAIVADRQGFADEIALHRVAAFIRQEAELLLGFHALGDDRHLKAVAETDDGPDDRRRVRVPSDIYDEGAVDLDLVERKRLQGAQRAIAAAAVIHGYATPQRLEPPQHGPTADKI